MKKSITIFLIFFLSITLHANNDRAIYIKKYSNETKTALVIGNSNYNNNSLSKLKNPVNDARAVRDKLKQKNFEVLYIEDATQREIDKMVRKFSDKLKSSGVGLFYFAGHGLEVDKKNYLVPIGANVSDEDDVKYESLAVNKIVDKMKRSGTRLNLVILDACRNNPFKRGAGGLAPMQNAKGTLIAYATDSGSTASDNVNESNGLFTKHFLKALDEPINQREFFHKIRMGVNDESRGRQLPYLNDGTIGNFYFTVSDIKYEKSTVNFKDIEPTSFSLTINTTPYNAKVQITNITPKYYDGIKLKKGSYSIKVSKDGYITKKGYIYLKSNTTLPITLGREEVVYTSKKVTQRSNGNVLYDKNTGTMWQDDMDCDSNELNFIEAKAHCTNSILGGYNDWRLPLKHELLSAKEIKYRFKYLSPSRYWSSSSGKLYYGHTIDGKFIKKKGRWTIGFESDVSVSVSRTSNIYYVRCVRSVKSN